MTEKKFGERHDGFFITFEGPEGAGKTTQLQLLREYLESAGHDCVMTREPGGTVIAEQLRALVKHHNSGEVMSDETELLLIAAGRAQHVRNLIIPALNAGKVVLCDRFFDSTTAYQGYARGIDLDFVRRLNRFACCGCIPDLTILFDISPEEGFARASVRVSTMNVADRIEAAGIEFHRRVYEGFRQIAAAEPERVKTVAASGSPDEIKQHIKGIVDHAFKNL